MDTPRVEIRPVGDWPPALIEDIHGWYRQVFAGTTGEVTEWAPAEHQAIVWLGRQWVSTLEIITRTVQVNSLPVQVGGVGGVTTRSEWVGRGHASAAMRAAVDFIANDLGLPFALLICGLHLVPFYHRLGWAIVGAGPAYSSSRGHHQFGVETQVMVYCCAHEPWPPGPIDLQGLPW